MKRLGWIKSPAGTYYSSIVCVPRRRLVASAKPMCSFDNVRNQRVDWVAWASIHLHGAHDAIDDVCTTSFVGAR